MVPPWIRRIKWVYFYTKSTVSFVVLIVVVVAVVYILFCLMHLVFFINVHLHLSLIEMGSPNLSTKCCNPAPLPFPNNNTVIILGICMEFLYENILLHFPWKTNTNSFYTQIVYLCAGFMSNSCSCFEAWVINWKHTVPTFIFILFFLFLH